jgi:hypothetical protein
MNARIEGTKLIVEIELNPQPEASRTGKTLLIASSHGNKSTQAKLNGKNVVVGLNAYIPIK